VSRSRAKKKQRRRSRAGAAAGGAGATAQERAATRTQARAPGATAQASPPNASPPRPPGRVSRLDVRDGVPRPDAVWAPFPLTEIGMAVGLALFVLGFAAGAVALFLAGVGVLLVVVTELCLREHFSGFRSHSLLLGLLPVSAVHLGVVYAGGVTWRGPLAVALDLLLAGALAWWLQRRFVAARGAAQLER